MAHASATVRAVVSPSPMKTQSGGGNGNAGSGPSPRPSILRKRHAGTPHKEETAQRPASQGAVIGGSTTAARKLYTGAQHNAESSDNGKKYVSALTCIIAAKIGEIDAGHR